MYVLKNTPPALEAARSKLLSACVEVQKANRSLTHTPLRPFLGGSFAWQLIDSQTNQTKIQTHDTDFFVSSAEAAATLQTYLHTIGDGVSTQYAGAKITTVKNPVTHVYVFYQFKHENIDYTIGSPVTYSNFNILINNENTVVYDPTILSHEADFQAFIKNGEIITYKLDEIIFEAYRSEYIFNNLAYVIKSYGDPITHYKKKFSDSTAKSLQHLFIEHPYLIQKLAKRLLHYSDRYPDAAAVEQYLDKLRSMLNIVTPESKIAALEEQLRAAQENNARLIDKLKTQQTITQGYEQSASQHEGTTQKLNATIKSHNAKLSEALNANQTLSTRLEEAEQTIARLESELATKPSPPVKKTQTAGTQTDPVSSPVPPGKQPAKINYAHIAIAFISKILAHNDLSLILENSFIRQTTLSFNNLSENKDFLSVKQQMNDVVSILPTINSRETAIRYVNLFKSILSAIQSHNQKEENDETLMRIFIEVDMLVNGVSYQSLEKSTLSKRIAELKKELGRVKYIICSDYINEISKLDHKTHNLLEALTKKIDSNPAVEERIKLSIQGTAKILHHLKNNISLFERNLPNTTSILSPTVLIQLQKARNFATNFTKTYRESGDDAPVQLQCAADIITKNNKKVNSQVLLECIAQCIVDANNARLQDNWYQHMAAYLNSPSDTPSEIRSTLARTTMKKVLAGLNEDSHNLLLERLNTIHFNQLLKAQTEAQYSRPHDDPLHMCLSTLLSPKLRATLANIHDPEQKTVAMGEAIHDAIENMRSGTIFPIGPTETFDERVLKILSSICKSYQTFCTLSKNGAPNLAILGEIIQALKTASYRAAADGDPDQTIRRGGVYFIARDTLSEEDKNIIYKAHLFKVADIQKAQAFKSLLTTNRDSLTGYLQAGKYLASIHDDHLVNINSLLTQANLEAEINTGPGCDPSKPKFDHKNLTNSMCACIEGNAEQQALLASLYSASKIDFFKKMFGNLTEQDFELLFNAAAQSVVPRPKVM